MKYHFLILLLFALLACGCSGDEPATEAPPTPVDPVGPQTPVEQPMAFVSRASAQSRAETPLQDTYKLFKVWSYKHGSGSTVQTVMPGYNVKYLGDVDRWQYDGNTFTSVEEFLNPVEGHTHQFLKYWDGSALSYAFYAFAPTSWPNVTCDENGITIPNIAGHTSTVSGSEVLVAEHRRDITGTLSDIDLLDQSYAFPSLGNFYDPVPLRFHHLFSRVTFKIYNCGDEPVKLWRGSVKLNNNNQFITKGSLVNDHLESNGEFDATSSTLTAFEYTTPKVLEANGTPETAELLTSMYEISQVLTPLDKDNITINVTVNNTIVGGTFTLPSNKWEFGKDYIYYLKIKVGVSSPILIDLTLDEFLHNDGDDIDETQTNW